MVCFERSTIDVRLRQEAADAELIGFAGADTSSAQVTALIGDLPQSCPPPRRGRTGAFAPAAGPCEGSEDK
ncbi:hypothetical protein, partial [Streptomyces chiangmaiensis]